MTLMRLHTSLNVLSTRPVSILVTDLHRVGHFFTQSFSHTMYISIFRPFTYAITCINLFSQVMHMYLGFFSNYSMSTLFIKLITIFLNTNHETNTMLPILGSIFFKVQRDVISFLIYQALFINSIIIIMFLLS